MFRASQENVQAEITSQNLNDLFYNSPVGIFTFAPDGNLLSVNPALTELHGYTTPGEMIDSITDTASHLYADPEDRNKLLHQLETQDQVNNFESLLLRRDGSAFWSCINIRAIRDERGRIIHYQGFVSDITWLKQNEEALRKNEEKYRVIFENTGTAICILEKNGTISLANTRFAELAGYALNEIENKKNWMEFVVPEDLERMFRQQELRNNYNKKALNEYEFRFVDKEKNIRNIFLYIDLIPGTDKSVASLLDITERKRVEESLRESQAKMQAITDSAQDAIVMMGPEGEIFYWNPMAETIFGYSAEEVMGKNLHRLLSPGRYYEAYSKAFPEFQKTGQGNAVGKTLEFFALRKDGSEFPVSISMSAVLLQGKWHAVGILRDITAKKQAEMQLDYRLRFEKLVSELSTRLLNMSSEETDEAVNYTISRIGSFFNVDRCYLFQFSADGKSMSKTHEWCAGGIESHMADTQNKIVKSLSWWMEKIRNHDYVHLDDTSSLPPEADAEREEFQRQGIKSLLNIPLISTQGLIGFFGFDSVKEKKAWNEETISFLQIIVVILTNALERSRTEQKFRYMSFHDSLTSLYNRTYFENELKRLQASREYPIAVVCVDVDGLKMVNDMFGHQQGDMVLKKCAKLLQEIFRSTDILARTGGDEFTVILPRTDVQTAKKVIQRIKPAIEIYNRKKAGSQLPLSISAGMSVAEDADRDLFAVFKEADDLMYRDKLNKDVTARSQIMRTILAALRERDFMTHGHGQRLEDLCRRLGETAGLSDKQISDLALLAQLHDLGKVGIPDHVLFKTGQLTDGEREIMYSHSEKGYIIAKSSTDLADIADLILKHHEQWDGKGYPLGLEGDKIPIECRILAIVDAYEAMTNHRPYRSVKSHKEAVEELKQCAGTQFDPELVKKFINLINPHPA